MRGANTLRARYDASTSRRLRPIFGLGSRYMHLAFSMLDYGILSPLLFAPSVLIINKPSPSTIICHCEYLSFCNISFSLSPLLIACILYHLTSRCYSRRLVSQHAGVDSPRPRGFGYLPHLLCMHTPTFYIYRALLRTLLQQVLPSPLHILILGPPLHQ
jgi:hypothetical protein